MKWCGEGAARADGTGGHRSASLQKKRAGTGTRTRIRTRVGHTPIRRARGRGRALARPIDTHADHRTASGTTIRPGRGGTTSGTTGAPDTSGIEGARGAGVRRLRIDGRNSAMLVGRASTSGSGSGRTARAIIDTRANGEGRPTTITGRAGPMGGTRRLLGGSRPRTAMLRRLGRPGASSVPPHPP